MNFEKNNGFIELSMFNLQELQTILKIKCNFIIESSDKKTVEIVNIDDYGIYETTHSETMSLDKLVAEYVQGGVSKIKIPVAEFKRVEPLIKISGKITNNTCSYFDYYNDVFIATYPPYVDGGSNKVYYFEDNNTILFFDENGPNLKTETTTSTFLDIVS